MMAKVKAELKSIFAPFVDGKLSLWTPDDPESFRLELQIFIGSVGDDLSDAFDVTVCTPKWLHENWHSVPEEFEGLPNVRSGHGFVLMQRWSFDDLGSTIRKICDVEANRWGDTANRIGRKLPWEYDYRYDRYQDEGRPFP